MIDQRFLLLVAIVFAVWMVLLASSRRYGAGVRRSCRACGAAHPAFARFCRRCGKRL